MKSLALRFNRQIFVLGLFFLFGGLALFVTGCAAPSFLEDLQVAVPTISVALGGILTLIGQLTKNPEFATAATELQTIATKVDDEIEAVIPLINDYKQNPDDTTLGNIETALNQIVSDIQPLLAPTGLPAAETAIIQTVAKTFVGEFEAILGTIQVFKSSTAGKVVPSFTKPLPSAALRSTLKAALSGTAGATKAVAKL